MYSREVILFLMIASHQTTRGGKLLPKLQIRQFHTKMQTKYRIGPHNVDVISVLVGSLLGDGYANQTKALIKGTNFRYKQSAVHKEYLFWLYEFFYSRGYCMNTGPREYKTILVQKSTDKNKTYYGYEFDLFTFSSLNWLYDLFYVNKVKRISPELVNYLTPLALAIWIMDDGGWVATSKSLRIATNNYTFEEVKLLVNILETKFNLSCTIQKLSKKGGNGPLDKYNIYFRVVSVPRIRELVKPYIIPSMMYKLGLDKEAK